MPPRPRRRRCGNCGEEGHNRRTCRDVIHLSRLPNMTPEQMVANSGLENTPRTRDALWRQIRNRIERRQGLTAADEPMTSRLDREIAALNDIQNHMATYPERPVDYSVRPAAARSRETVSLMAHGAATTPSSILLPAVREINPPAHIPVSAPAPAPSTSTPAPEPEEPPREVKVIESESCPVCMEDFDGKTKIDKATLKCGHQICSGCLATWMRENHTCPSCREPIADKIVKRYTLSRRVREHLVAMEVATMGADMVKTFCDAIRSFSEDETRNRDAFAMAYFEKKSLHLLEVAADTLQLERN